jgi:conjugal transfer pilus assembly protein TraV
VIRRAAVVALCAAALVLGGCAIGSSDYGCPGMPSKPLCLPTSEIYRLTNGSLAPAQMSPVHTDQQPDQPEERPCCNAL